jgi:hypothetical protein
MEQARTNRKAQAKVRNAILALEFAKSIFEEIELSLNHREKNPFWVRLQGVMSTDEGVRQFVRDLLSEYLK